MYVSCECWVLSGEVTEKDRSLVQRIPTEGGVPERDFMQQYNNLNLQ